MQESTELTQFIARLSQQLPFLTQRYHVKSLGLFGSYVRHEQHSGSDVDVLVSFSESPSLLEFIELEDYLTDILGIQVDLVMADALKPGIEEHILGEAIAI